MELELGLKITKTRDDLTSTTDFRMVKDPSGPIFMSRETESKFILTAHLKGFGREHIAIKINEDGTQIAISWEKPIQEMVMSGWMMHKKEVELKGFIRNFRIPDGVVLDRIKAKFNEQESVLTILMPKSVKGIRGVGIEEVKEEEEVIDRGVKEVASTNEVPKIVGNMEESDQIFQKKADKGRSTKETSSHKAKEKEIVGGKTKDKIEEPKIKSRHENRGVPGESSKKEGGTIGPTKKIDEDPNIAKKEESNLVGKEKVDEAKLKRTQLVMDKLPRKEDEKEHYVKSSEETEQQKEKISTAQKTKVGQVTKQTNKEAPTTEDKLVKPEIKQFPEMEKKIKKQEIPEENNKAFGMLERGDTTDRIKKVEGEVLEELEAIVNSIHPTEEHHEDEEVREREENREKEDEVEEEAPKDRKEHPDQEKEENEHDSPHVEEKKDTGGEVSQRKKKPSSRTIKLCTPCVIAGSSIVVSLVVIAIHWIRSKKREVR